MPIRYGEVHAALAHSLATKALADKHEDRLAAIEAVKPEPVREDNGDLALAVLKSLWKLLTRSMGANHASS